MPPHKVFSGTGSRFTIIQYHSQFQPSFQSFCSPFIINKIDITARIFPTFRPLYFYLSAHFIIFVDKIQLIR